MNNEIQQKIRGAIRQVWSRYSLERRAVLARSKRYFTVTNKDGTTSKRPKVGHYCEVCNTLTPAKDIAVDHIDPVGATPAFPPTQSNIGAWGIWLLRLFCSIENLQAICRSCHNNKTAAERRKKTKARKNVQRLRSKRQTTKTSSKRHPKVVRAKLGQK